MTDAPVPPREDRGPVGWVTAACYLAFVGIGFSLIHFLWPTPLLFSLFMIAAYKGFGKRGVIASFIIITIFGALIPATSPLVITAFVRQGVGLAIPAQVFFGPAALVTYWLLARHTPERSIGEWISEQDAAGHEPIRVVRRNRPRPAAARSVQPVADIEIGVEQAV